MSLQSLRGKEWSRPPPLPNCLILPYSIGLLAFSPHTGEGVRGEGLILALAFRGIRYRPSLFTTNRTSPDLVPLAYISPYALIRSAQEGEQYRKAGLVDIINGFFGVLYRKRFFYATSSTAIETEVYNYSAHAGFMQHCALVDDVWFSGHLGACARSTEPYFLPSYLPTYLPTVPYIVPPMKLTISTQRD